MGTLFLVRHAQASFLQPNYDKLSALGETQSRMLGEYWAQQNLVFDRVCIGPCVRHQDTFKFVSDAYHRAGLPLPTPQVLPEFDEYPAEAVIRRSLPGLLESDERIRDLYAAFQASTDLAIQRKTFQKLYEVVIHEWVAGSVCPPDVETWVEFCSRVNSGLTRVLSTGEHGERVAVFTSGGPIAVAVQRSLQLSAENTLQVSWMSRNSSWSEFLYNAVRFTMSTFNSHPHIGDSETLTYR
jgi:broad specificity phosphatase PhoE